MAETNNNQNNVVESEDIKRLNDYIEDQYTTAGETLPVVTPGEVTNPDAIEEARVTYEAMLNPEAKDDDAYNSAGHTRAQLRDLYSKGIPIPGTPGIDESQAIKHTVSASVEDGKTVVTVDSHEPDSRPVRISEPPTNISSSATWPGTDTSSVVAPVPESQQATEKERENNAKLNEILLNERQVTAGIVQDISAKNTTPDLQPARHGNQPSTSSTFPAPGDARPTTTATPVPSKPASSPSDVPTDENNTER